MSPQVVFFLVIEVFQHSSIFFIFLLVFFQISFFEILCPPELNAGSRASLMRCTDAESYTSIFRPHALVSWGRMH